MNGRFFFPYMLEKEGHDKIEIIHKLLYEVEHKGM
ncbi:hypothetical protein P615_12950 [Brevibacillus laterosporus PE36]|nr:hypothetical protein P615_12950 [Brevibacillus laterosporus PE36]